MMTNAKRFGRELLSISALIAAGMTNAARAEFSTDDFHHGRVKDKQKYPVIQMWERDQEALRNGLGKNKGKVTNRKIARVRKTSSVSDIGCPSSTTLLGDWRKQVMDTVYAAAPDRNGPEYSVAHTAALDETAELIQRCFPTKVPACLEDLKRYSTTLPSVGNIEPEYNSTLAVTSTKQLPEEFWVKDENGNVKEGVFQFPPNLINLAPQKGWKVAIHKTRGQGGFETGPNLLIVGIPGPQIDIVMQIQILHESDYDSQPDHYATDPMVHTTPIPFTLEQYSQETGGGSRYPTRVTVITADHTKSPAVGQLRFVNRKPGTIEFEWKNEGDYPSCHNCHATPFRNISPVGYKKVHPPEQRMSEAQEASVDGVNDLMANFSSPPLSWGSAIRHTDKGDRIVDFGPSMDSFPLGWRPEGVTPTEDFISTCMKKVDSFSPIVRGPLAQTFKMGDSGRIRKDKVIRAMNCYSCHNGSYRGPITETVSQDTLGFKILVDQSMPPNAPADLTVDERLAVYGCLQAERDNYRAAWQKAAPWINSVSCEGSAGAASASGGGGRR